jgi:hypothetical protein
MGPSSPVGAHRSGTARATPSSPPAISYLAGFFSLQRSGHTAGIAEHPPIWAVPAGPPNQALKLARLSACLLGGRAFVQHAAMQWPCPSSAVQLNAGVRLDCRQSGMYLHC